MHWPQWTYIALAGLGWLVTLIRHGQPKKGNEDIGIHTAGLGIAVLLLWQGGFFG